MTITEEARDPVVRACFRAGARRRGLEGPLALRTRVVATIAGHEELGWIQGRSFDGPCRYDLQLDSGYQVIGIPAASVMEELGQLEPDE